MSITTVNRSGPAARIYDPLWPAVIENPYPFYARMRAEAPVFPITGPFGIRAWLATRYDDGREFRTGVLQV